MNFDPATFKELFAATRILNVVQAAIIIFGGMLLVRVASRSLDALLRRTLEPQQAAMGGKISSYLMTGIVALSALRQLGFDLQVFLGAAGILTVALGFASQTSVANIISGLFIIFEKPFVLGDWVKVGASGIAGEVLSIGLLSTRIRTGDNLMVRYPNEMLMKAEITNLTRHPIRRFDLRMGVAYTQNLRNFRRMLLD
ncbi:MAG: mechanosensitive ion channel family protein, partial [Proteobacteria bacterium]|nr:mechanosensitive ion channel family protein [Pseudomonadota bacterium]